MIRPPTPIRPGATHRPRASIGSGRSPVADEHYIEGTFTVELFRAELARLRELLSLDEVILVGQSWGVMLALEHVLDGADGVRGLVLMSGPASIEEWNAETTRLRSELPADVRDVLAREEAAGRVESPEFKAAYAVWERTHVLRMDVAGGIEHGAHEAAPHLAPSRALRGMQADVAPELAPGVLALQHHELGLAVHAGLVIHPESLDGEEHPVEIVVRRHPYGQFFAHWSWTNQLPLTVR